VLALVAAAGGPGAASPAWADDEPTLVGLDVRLDWTPSTYYHFPGEDPSRWVVGDTRPIHIWGEFSDGSLAPVSLQDVELGVDFRYGWYPYNGEWYPGSLEGWASVEPGGMPGKALVHVAAVPTTAEATPLHDVRFTATLKEDPAIATRDPYSPEVTIFHLAVGVFAVGHAYEPVVVLNRGEAIQLEYVVRPDGFSGELVYTQFDSLYVVGGATDSYVDSDGVLAVGLNEQASQFYVAANPPNNFLAASHSQVFEVRNTVAPPEPLALSASVSKKCMGGKAYLVVQAWNDSDVAVSLEVATDYGVKAFPAVAPGAGALQMFATKASAYPSGQVELAASAGSEPQARSGLAAVGYSAASCG
jgi:hypothetical protein